MEEGIKGYEDEVSGWNARIKESEMLIAKYEKQLESVKNNREYDALTKELELQKLEIQLAEKKINDIGKNIESRKESLDAANENLDSKKGDLENKKEELEKIIVKTDKEESSLLRKSKSAEKKIEDRLLKAYQKIRSAYKNGLAVVTVVRDSCGGCYNKVPTAGSIRNWVTKENYCLRTLWEDSY